MEKQLGLSTNVAKLHQMFGKKLYASKYSWICEICQNAVDSHRMAKVSEPVEIGIRYHEKDKNIRIFYVKDIGLSFTDQDDFVKKVCTLLESGKSEIKTSEEDCPMGMHGIGTISVSAFQSQWKYTVVTPTKQKFEATLKEVEGKGLTYSMTEPKRTTLPKSVLFEVEIPYGGERALIQEMMQKLAYFKDIYFNFPEDFMRGLPFLVTLNTDFEIFDAPDFQFSTLSKQNAVHISLDQYTYPINWDKLGINLIPINIGLKFNMTEGLVPDITRENLQYTDDYADIIKAKLTKAADWIVNHYNSNTTKEFTSYESMVDAITGPLKINLGDEHTMYINSIVPFSTIKPIEPQFKDVSRKIFDMYKHARDSNHFRPFTRKFDITSNGSKVKKDSDYSYNNQHIIYVDEDLSKRKLDYLRQQYPSSGLFYDRGYSIHSKDNNKYSYSKLFKFPKKEVMREHYFKTGVNLWRRDMEQIKILEKSEARDTYILLSEIKVPESFNKGPKKVGVRKPQGVIGIKYAEKMDKESSTFSCKFVEKAVNVADFYKIPLFHIYGTDDKRPMLNAIYKMYKYSDSKNNRMRVCTVNKTAKPVIDNLKLHNFMDVEKFLEGKHRLFRQMITAHLIHAELLYPFNGTFSHIEIIRRFISTDIATEMDTMIAYHKSFGMSIHNKDEHIEAMVKLAKDLKLYDLEIWESFQNLKEKLVRYDYINFLSTFILSEDNLSKIKKTMPNHSMIVNHNKVVGILHEIGRQRGIRMDNCHYKKEENGTEG